MDEFLTLPALNFCIVSSTPLQAELIRNAFRELPLVLSLHKVYSTASSFLKTELQTGLIDFIATDTASFGEPGPDDNGIACPVILFSEQAAQLPYSPVFARLSPADRQGLEMALRKLMNLKAYFTAKKEELHPNSGKAIASKTFIIKKGKEFHLVNSDNIPAFYTDNKITFAYDNTGKKYMVQYTLIELENILNPNIFFRANRQFLVNRNYINKIRQVEELKFEIIIESGDLLSIDINQQKFSKFKSWIESE